MDPEPSPRRRRRATRFLLAFLAAAAAAPAGTAGACDSASCSLLTRGGNGLVPRKKFRLDLSFGYTDQGRLQRGSEEVDVVLRPRVVLERRFVFPNYHRDINGYDRGVQMDLSYGLSSRLNLAVSLPLSTWHAHDVAHGDLQQEFGTQGFGDTLVGARAAFGPRGLVEGFSLKLPTGDYRIGGEFGGGIQDPTLQPGTGAWDFVGLLQYSRRAASLHLDWSLSGTYQATTTNSLGYRFGNQAIFTAGVSRAVARPLVASLQAKLFHQDRSQYLGRGVPSTGSTTLYVTPGLRLSVPRGLSFYAFVLFSPYRYVNEAQLTTSLAVLAGASKFF
jgi:hypothetical protein